VTVVRIPSPLFSYTSKPEVEAQGATVGELLADLDRRYPGLRFRIVDEQDRIRSTIIIAVSGNRVGDLAAAVGPKDVVTLIAALSGG
jgi:molybdopterin converting factor small subunit